MDLAFKLHKTYENHTKNANKLHNYQEVFTAVKEGRLEQQTSIFEPSLTHFPRHINTCSLDMIKAPTLRKNTLLRVSPLLFLNHF